PALDVLKIPEPIPILSTRHGRVLTARRAQSPFSCGEVCCIWKKTVAGFAAINANLLKIKEFS
ncbi:MAG TPA: hypothetical protein VE092_17565, partial [Herbaspirillum sp.]|uniref:hypothetical protein n=1 Tax=Herbaspirillum sp. TaxID=1890675 RepID=UPI002D2862E4